MRNFLVGTLLFAIILSSAAGIHRSLKDNVSIEAEQQSPQQQSPEQSYSQQRYSEQRYPAQKNGLTNHDLHSITIETRPGETASNPVYQNLSDKNHSPDAPDNETPTETFDEQLMRLLAVFSTRDHTEPSELFTLLQDTIINNDENAQRVMMVMRSEQLSQDEKFILAQLLSARTDDVAMGFATQLILETNPANQMLGAELAHHLMKHGAVADTLTPILAQAYHEENKDIVRTVLYGLGNITMSPAESNRVSELLENYLTYGDADIQPVALQSLASLYAAKNQTEKIKSLYVNYQAKSYAEQLRYSAVESLYNLNASALDERIENLLMAMAEDKNESHHLRRLAMQILEN